jgi:aspartyl-tRNA(Asn)/glutamyl-tRNA(Gln) amidotransferase subunit B
MNSFKNVQRAIDFEIKRHIDVLESGNKVIQETRLWDDASNITRSMRAKEESHDYRYFPEPDLVPIIIDDTWIKGIEKTLPELARSKRERFVKEYSLPAYDSDVLTQSKDIADYFEACVQLLDRPKEISNWIMTDVLRILKEGCTINDLNVSPEMLTSMIRLINEEVISGKIAKDVFEEMACTGKSPQAIIEEKGLVQIMDEKALKLRIDEIIKNNPKEVEAYKKGKTQLLAFFIGQVMKQTSGKANPGLTEKLIKEALEK